MNSSGKVFEVSINLKNDTSYGFYKFGWILK